MLVPDRPPLWWAYVAVTVAIALGGFFTDDLLMSTTSVAVLVPGFFLVYPVAYMAFLVVVLAGVPDGVAVAAGLALVVGGTITCAVLNAELLRLAWRGVRYVAARVW